MLTEFSAADFTELQNSLELSTYLELAWYLL